MAEAPQTPSVSLRPDHPETDGSPLVETPTAAPDLYELDYQFDIDPGYGLFTLDVPDAPALHDIPESERFPESSSESDSDGFGADVRLIQTNDDAFLLSGPSNTEDERSAEDGTMTVSPTSARYIRQQRYGHLVGLNSSRNARLNISMSKLPMHKMLEARLLFGEERGTSTGEEPRHSDMRTDSSINMDSSLDSPLSNKTRHEETLNHFKRLMIQRGHRRDKDAELIALEKTLSVPFKDRRRDSLKSNSTSSMYVRSTMHAQNSETILNMASALSTLIVLAGSGVEGDDTEGEDEELTVAFTESKIALDENWNSMDITHPTITTIKRHLQKLVSAASLDPECLVMAMAFVDRVLEISRSNLRASTWRPVTMCAVVLAGKLWGDALVKNCDFKAAYPSFPLAKLNLLEVRFLEMIRYNFAVSPKLYARYYFELRGQHISSRSHRPLTLSEVSALEGVPAREDGWGGGGQHPGGGARIVVEVSGDGGPTTTTCDSSPRRGSHHHHRSLSANEQLLNRSVDSATRLSGDVGPDDNR